MTSPRVCRTEQRRPPHGRRKRPAAPWSAHHLWGCSLAARLWVCRRSAQLGPGQTAVTPAR